MCRWTYDEGASQRRIKMVTLTFEDPFFKGETWKDSLTAVTECTAPCCNDAKGKEALINLACQALMMELLIMDWCMHKPRTKVILHSCHWVGGSSDSQKSGPAVVMEEVMHQISTPHFP